jgi:hypothetical protein
LTRIGQLPEEQIWQAMELAYVPLGVQYFHVCRPDRDAATYQMPWDSERLLDCIPMLSARLVKASGAGGSVTWGMVRPGVPPIPLTEVHAAIVSHIDGGRTVRACVAAAGIRGDGPTVMGITRDLFRRLWRCGFGILRW